MTQTNYAGNSYTESQSVLVELFRRGYRVSDSGVFTNPSGRPFELKLKSNHKYPQTQMRLEGKVHNFLIHRFAAYCFYGEEIFVEGVVVRHLNGNVLDISKGNIALGSYSDNEQDKNPEVRSRNASIATSMRRDTRRLSMRKLTDDQVRDIRRRLSDGDTGVAIAKDYGVVRDVIYAIRKGTTYKDVI